jgi:cob(I)alamin adenosyltransferase
MSKKIYTKTGDNGTTSLLGGTKVPKDDWRLDAYGSVDELNSFVGMLSDTMSNEIRLFRNTTDQLDKIQNNLFVIGSCLSYDQLGKIKLELQKISQEDIQQLEDWIDQMDSELPELKNFIIPGGDVIISNAHICRTISRRAERRCVPAQNHPLIQIYLNRLSDYFFVVARYATKQLGYKDKIWAS